MSNTLMQGIFPGLNTITKISDAFSSTDEEQRARYLNKLRFDLCLSAEDIKRLEKFGKEDLKEIFSRSRLYRTFSRLSAFNAGALLFSATAFTVNNQLMYAGVSTAFLISAVSVMRDFNKDIFTKRDKALKHLKSYRTVKEKKEDAIGRAEMEARYAYLNYEI